MRQTPLLAFESAVFPHSPDENGKTHPRIYGRALANWLAEQLRGAGVPAQKVIAEDFGWCVPVKSDSQSLYIVCAGSHDQPNHFKVFGFVEEGVISKLIGKDKTADSLAALFQTVKACLSEDPTIENLREEK
jgi:hypothetical protein